MEWTKHSQWRDRVGKATPRTAWDYGWRYHGPCLSDAIVPDPTDEAAMIRVGCTAADIHLTCAYPDCSCVVTPTAIRAVLAALAAHGKSQPQS